MTLKKQLSEVKLKMTSEQAVLLYTVIEALRNQFKLEQLLKQKKGRKK